MSYPVDDAGTFGAALRALKRGEKVRRTTWRDGKTVLILREGPAGPATRMAYVWRGAHSSTWSPTHGDLLAEDWEIAP